MGAAQRVRVVVFREGDWWVGQCLEYDIAAQAKTLSDLHYEFGRLLVGHYALATERGRPPFEDVPPAPERYWKLFDQAKSRLDREPVLFRVPTSLLDLIPTPDLRIAELV